MTSDELITRTTQEMKGHSDDFVSDDYINAVESAQEETGWTLPQTNSFRVHWLIERTKRALFFMLATGSTKNFKVASDSFDQQFQHYMAILKLLDTTYEKAIEEHPEEFAGVDAYKFFGHKVDAGFAYDKAGQDITHDADKSVKVTP